ncbi:hypothetical protein E8D34_09365 [Nocardioides sp. GY 10113]|uniref:hypothetical protein n=1 Tax=Nocardioides sp. GY 10113 TaxID=2569761 RepID=UPI0010A8A146|nr:hypothetical protein [Nocardioides sp. GY 10113]TIC87339.1 hypothetical protein E8D34_09365 [Nocardioides sp. GY 10113]
MGSRPRFRRGVAAAAGGMALVAALAACGGDDNGETGSGSGSSDPVVVRITFDGDTVTPVGERVEVEAGQPVDLEVTADQPGELHIHSDPEQELEYPAGTQTFKIAIDRPGVVAVESHDLDQVVVQLEVQ